MMKTIKSILILILALVLISCDDSDEPYYDNIPPSPPTNVRTYSGDNQIDITWRHAPENDVAGYNIYFAWDYYGEYELIGSTSNNYFIDTEANNGEKYYYAVTAYDFNNNESELSTDVIYDIARPEGYNQAIYDYLKFPSTAGYDFSNYLIVAYNSDAADFFFENFNGTFYLDVWEDSDIQDMGPTSDLYEIDYAPVSGWVPIQPNENIKYVEAKVGHTYIVWTWDNHFAKIRINRITNERVVFDWVYQLVEGEPKLKRREILNRETPNEVQVKR
ncbi:MAG: hypothetical protein CMF23_02985 [Ignavibacteriae bacterium]|nr:hypothetical protein [Ignavibacteriota bacterium]